MPRKSSAAVAFSPSTATRVHPPDDLTGDARKLFVDIVLACRADHFQNSDVALLCIFCRAVILERTASAGLAADGYVTDDGKPSAWLPILAQATRTSSTYSRMLKLNPAGRQSVPSSEPEAVSAYERMALEAQRDGRN
jgi:hypothetical protein